MLKKIEITKATTDKIIITPEKVIVKVQEHKLFKTGEDKYVLKAEYRDYITKLFNLDFEVTKTFKSNLNMKYDVIVLYSKSTKINERMIINLKENIWEIRNNLQGAA